MVFVLSMERMIDPILRRVSTDSSSSLSIKASSQDVLHNNNEQEHHDLYKQHYCVLVACLFFRVHNNRDSASIHPENS
jgi:hypothetical protein